MDQGRRKFLQQMAGSAAAGIAQKFKIGASLAAGSVAATTAAGATVAATAVAATAATRASAGSVLAVSPYGTGVRAQVAEVIVRQALAGAPWKEICKGPMHVNGITEDEIEKEVALRKLTSLHTGAKNCRCVDCLHVAFDSIREKQRLHRLAMASISHSKESPCACNACFDSMLRTRHSKLL